MEEIANILANFSQSLRNEILQYYERCYDYIKDLFADKNIDIKFKTNYENTKEQKHEIKYFRVFVLS